MLVNCQINVPVTNGKTYAVSFDAAIHSPYDVSNHFCRENARELGLESEMHITQGCIPSVGKYVEDQLEAMGFVRPEGRAEVQQVQAQQQEIQQQEQQVQEVQQEVSGESSAETATANAPVATEQ